MFSARRNLPHGWIDLGNYYHVMRATISHTALSQAEKLHDNSLVLPYSSAGINGEADVRRPLVLRVLRLEQVAVKELLTLVSLDLVTLLPFRRFTDCCGCGGVSLGWLCHLLFYRRRCAPEILWRQWGVWGMS